MTLSTTPGGVYTTSVYCVLLKHPGSVFRFCFSSAAWGKSLSSHCRVANGATDICFVVLLDDSARLRLQTSARDRSRAPLPIPFSLHARWENPQHSITELPKSRRPFFHRRLVKLRFP